MDHALSGFLERLQDANFVLATSQRVQVMNRCAEKLTREARIVSIGTDNTLRFVEAADHSAYRNALKSALEPASGGFFSLLVGPIDGKTAELSVLSLSPSPIALSDADSVPMLVSLRCHGEQIAVEENLLIQRYRLSMAEAAVVRLFASGATLQEIAEARGVGYLAVRNQLSAAKQKMGVRRQSEIFIRINDLLPRLLPNQHYSRDSDRDG